MSVFLKVIAGVFTAVILWICVGKENKGISVLLSLVVCSAVLTVAFTFLQPVIDFMNRIQLLGNINEDMLKVMLKVVGIGLLAEVSMLICKDAGNETMGKSIQIMSVILIIKISIPVFEMLITLLDDILGTI